MLPPLPPLLVALALLAGGCEGAARLAATDPRVQWAGRTVQAGSGAVAFDWLGVSARVQVANASWVTVTATTNATVRGTRLQAYVSYQSFPLYPITKFWLSPLAGNTTLLYGSSLPPYNASSATPTTPPTTLVTLENTVSGQPLTTIHHFETDGEFIAPPPRLPGRNLEFVGDSITAATNMVRPAGAPSCADHEGFQSDWSQSYAGLLCHHFNASCSTIAVGGKCVMRECGGPKSSRPGSLQMPDYYRSALTSDAPRPTYDFGGWKPDAVLINLGTNDMRAIHGMKTHNGSQPGFARFTEETVAFMRNVTELYSKRDIVFFLSTGPIENRTAAATEAAVAQAEAEGLAAVWVDMEAACVGSRLHAADDADGCDGCSEHPGLEGHRGMFEAAAPVIAKRMGWGAHGGG